MEPYLCAGRYILFDVKLVFLLAGHVVFNHSLERYANSVKLEFYRMIRSIKLRNQWKQNHISQNLSRFRPVHGAIFVRRSLYSI